MSDLLARVTDPKATPFERLVRLMAILRSEQGCNWDRQQTHESLVPYLIEETYEVVEAVQSGNMADLSEELGDLLCQIVFHAQLAAERGDFNIDDVAQAIVDKLIHRHPHVFGERQELSPGQVRDQWEKIKSESGERPSALEGLPKSMPALTMAFRIGEKAGGLGFDWTTAKEVIAKLREELDEIEAAMDTADTDNHAALADEVGDLLFAASSLARKLRVDPESALKRALEKFRRRFETLQENVRSGRGSFDRYSLEELEEMWQTLKKDTEQ
ncbi:MAG: nucleoside triphosphate pyrophosphohydrolase [Candidatus Zixiibacteriota bacterium]|nr:MAG: nucleoside triphosphate pyrophosphohydrolase [candidate division Zixibacteria bacterium]